MIWLIECNQYCLQGGGRDFLGRHIPTNSSQYAFKGNAEKSCNRLDNIDLVDHWITNKTNVKYVTNAEELSNIDPNEIDFLMGLFANNHMSYELVRNKNVNGEPSLSAMTRTAIKVLNNKNNHLGFVLLVEGGRIDQAHHQNLGRIALHEFVEFEKAVQEAVDLTNEDTLIIVTSDHSHAMTMNGYADRGNDIFGWFFLS